MNKMDKQYIEQQDIVGQYLRGQLTPEETVEFEIYLMDHPQLVERLEIDGLMARAMPAAYQASEKPAKGRFWWWLQTPLGASFATLLVCVLSLPLINGYLQDDVSTTDEVLVNIQHIQLHPPRGKDISEQIPVVQPLSTDRYFELMVQPSDFKATGFEVEIAERNNGKVVLHKRRFDVTSNGEFKLMLPLGAYPDGAYVLTAMPVYDKQTGGQAKPEKFYFDVRHR